MKSLLPLVITLGCVAGVSAEERVYAFDLLVGADGRVEQLRPRAGSAVASAELVAAQVRQWTFEPTASAATPAETHLRVLARNGPAGVSIVDATIGPRPRVLTPPLYPDADQRRGREGVVVVRLDLDATGRVTSAGVHSMRGDISRGMGEAALAAVQSWWFEPERIAGKPIAAQVLMPVCFASEPGEGMCTWTGPDARRRGSREIVSLRPSLRVADAAALMAAR